MSKTFITEREKIACKKKRVFFGFLYNYLVGNVYEIHKCILKNGSVEGFLFSVLWVQFFSNELKFKVFPLLWTLYNL